MLLIFYSYLLLKPKKLCSETPILLKSIATTSLLIWKFLISLRYVVPLSYNQSIWIYYWKAPRDKHYFIKQTTNSVIFGNKWTHGHCHYLFKPVFHNLCNNLTMQNISRIVRIYNLQKTLDTSLSNFQFPFLMLPKRTCEFQLFEAKRLLWVWASSQ